MNSIRIVPPSHLKASKTPPPTARNEGSFVPKKTTGTQPTFWGTDSRQEVPKKSSLAGAVLPFALILSNLLSPFTSLARSTSLIQNNEGQAVSATSRALSVQNSGVDKPTLKPENIQINPEPNGIPFQTYVFMYFTMPKGYYLETNYPADSEGNNVIQATSYRLDAQGNTIPVQLDVGRYYVFSGEKSPFIRTNNSVSPGEDSSPYLNEVVVQLNGAVTPNTTLKIKGGVVPIIKVGEEDQPDKKTYLEEQNITLPTFAHQTTDLFSATIYENRPFAPDMNSNSLKSFSKLAYEGAPEPSKAIAFNVDELTETILRHAKPFTSAHKKKGDQKTATLLLKLYQVLQGQSVEIKGKEQQNPLADYLKNPMLQGIVEDPQLAAALVSGSNLLNEVPPLDLENPQPQEPVASNGVLTGLLDAFITTEQREASFEKIEFATFGVTEQDRFTRAQLGPNGRTILQINDKYRHESPLVLFPLIVQGMVLYQRESNTNPEPSLTKERAENAWAMATLAYTYQLLSLQQTEKGKELLTDLLKTNKPEPPTALVQFFNTLFLALVNSGGAPDLRPGFLEGPISVRFPQPLAFPGSDDALYTSFKNVIENFSDVAEFPYQQYDYQHPPALPPLLGKLLAEFTSPEVPPLYQMADRDVLTFLSKDTSLSTVQLFNAVKELPIKGSQGFPSK